LSWQGAYLPTTIYALADGVMYQGSAYVSLVAGNLGNAPAASPAAWSLLALGGAAGTPGATGPQGPAGTPGAAGTQGLQGPKGDTGAAGMNFRGAWSAGTVYTANDAVTFGGSTYLAEAGNTASPPDLYPQAWAMLAQAGGAGPTGATGASATVSVGTVTTGAPGTQALVTLSGTSSAAVLNFTIPQGVAGAAGSGGGGGGGTSGIPFASVYHAASNANLYYSVNSSNAAAMEFGTAAVPAGVLTWVPTGCTATALYVSSLQPQTITVTLRAGTPGNMVDTALSCSAAPGGGGSCPATGSVVIPAGSFADLSMSGANGTAAGVWTALACN
jgi:hypothetical protein